jgi:hypothetical protein
LLTFAVSMNTQPPYLILTAFAGLAGALLTQLLTGLFSYINDHRKQKTEVQALYRGKKVEIGESFYFINGELMAMIKKNIAYWRNRRDDRSDTTLGFLRQEMDRLDAYQAKLQAENWKYNLIGIYYTIPYSFHAMLEDNQRSHEIYLEVLDYSERIKLALPAEKEDFFQDYQEIIATLCAHYERVYAQMEDNMGAVKNAMLADFGA